MLMLLLPAKFSAQVSTTGATLEGVVRDETGGVMAGVEVRIRNTATGSVRVVSTDGLGDFRASELAVGTYEVTVSRSGFAPYLHTGVTLTLGQTSRLNIQLRPASEVERITVTDQPPIINPSETTVTSTIAGEPIEELPVRTRNALDFVLLAPGVAASRPQTSVATHMPLTGSGFSFGGLRPRSNSLSIDGMENNDEFSGGSRMELSPEIVREFQVVNNGISAEYGGASGGSINVVTRTGTNTAHGDAFLFYQGAALNARESLSVPDENGKPPLTRFRAGLARGGPLVKDRTFYYAAFEQEHLRTEEASDIDPWVASTMNALLAAGTFPRLTVRQVTTGTFPISQAETEASAKIDHQLSDRHSLMLRYAFTNNRNSSEGFNENELTDASARGSLFTLDNGLVGSLTSLRGSNAVNALRFQLARRSVSLRTNDPIGPGIQINGMLDFGRPYAGNSRHREDHYDLADTHSRTMGHHLFKLGGSGGYVHLNSFAPDGFGGVYTFPTLADFLAGTPDAFYQAFGNPYTAFGVPNYGLFFQDHWSLTKQATLDLGVRYDKERLPSGFNQDTDNLSPRVGLAYSPSRRWVVRAGYGIFYDRYLLASLNRALENRGPLDFDQDADGDEATSVFSRSQLPFPGGHFPGGPFPDIEPSIFRADPHLATPYSQQANLGLQLLLSKDLIASTNFSFVRGIRLSRTRNANLPPPTVLTPANSAALGIPNPTPQQMGREVFGLNRLDPELDSDYLLEHSAGSTYHGVSFSVEKRSEDFTLIASYTLSRTIDDASDFAEQPQNPFDLRGERARSLIDQEHHFVMSGLFELPFGENEGGASASSRKQRSFFDRLASHIELAPIVTVGSGRPADPLTGLDSNRSHAFPLSSRPLGFRRNSLLTPTIASVDLRILKAIYLAGQKHLDLVIESFNLINHNNISMINPYFGMGLAPLPGFGRPITALNARQIQFSIDFEY